MEFEWDEAKSDRCLAQRGFDFAYVLRAFFDSERVIRVISARKANKREVDDYENSTREN